MEKEKTVTITFALPEDLKNEFGKVTKALDIDASKMLRKSIREIIKKNKK